MENWRRQVGATCEKVRSHTLSDRLSADGVRRGYDAVGELINDCPAHNVLAFKFRRSHEPHINVGGPRRALRRRLSADAYKHATRHLVGCGSLVTKGAAVDGPVHGHPLDSPVNSKPPERVCSRWTHRKACYGCSPR